MKNISILTSLLIFLFGGACSAPHSKVTTGSCFDYEIRIVDPATECVRVTAIFEGLEESSDPLRFSLLRGHTFIRLEEPLLEGEVTATAAGSPLPIERISPFTWQVDRRGAANVRLDYTVPLRHRRLPEIESSHDHYEFPYLAADHGMLTTWTLCMTPQGVEPEAIHVSFALPDGWDVITPWPSAAEESEETVFAPESRAALTGDLVAVGAWKSHTVQVGDFEGTVAFAPGQDALAEAAVEPIGRIVANELTLFGRPPTGRYLFLFGRPDTPGAGGSPKTNSMTLTVNPSLGPHAFSFLGHLVAHEFHHTWTASLYSSSDRMRWFNEGFTDYYAHLVAVRVGLSTWKEFAAMLGRKMAECHDNPHAGSLSLADAGGEIFFRDRDAYRLVYTGGLLAAAWLDRAIRAHADGRSLDDFMRSFNNDPRWSLEGRAPGMEDFLKTLAPFVDGEILPAMEELVREPFSFDPVQAFAVTGVAVIRRKVEPVNELPASRKRPAGAPPPATVRFDVAVAPWRTHALPGREGSGTR
jgi:predicted metalloprotease with PDZ domain